MILSTGKNLIHLSLAAMQYSSKYTTMASPGQDILSISTNFAIGATQQLNAHAKRLMIATQGSLTVNPPPYFLIVH